MFVVCLHSIAGYFSGRPVASGIDAFVDISSDGQLRRRFSAGCFQRNGESKDYTGILHYCKEPVTLRMAYGPFYSVQHLGVHTLFEFLHPHSASSLPIKHELIFGREDSIHFLAKISVQKIVMNYKFELNEIICLNQNSFFLRKDRLSAEVEFNCCLHSVHPGHKNSYELGSYKSQNSSSVHTCSTMNFSTVSNFRIRLQVKDMVGDHTLCQFRFTPQYQIDSPPTDADGHTYFPLLFQRQENEEGTIIFGANLSPFALRSMIAKSADESGAVYEISFTVRCEPIVDTVLITPHSWNYIGKQTTKNKTEKLLKIEKTAPFSLSNTTFGSTTDQNSVELLIDGKETFQRYFECICQAQHSINILAWELSLSFGLVEANSFTSFKGSRGGHGGNGSGSAKWISLADVLLARAKLGVKIRIIVWRHSMMKVLNRLKHLYMGPVEQEVAEFKERAEKMNLSFKVIHSSSRTPTKNSLYADPASWAQNETIVVIIAGNPRGLISCHHEKLLLIDPECPRHTMAFTGGFDITHGRYDQSDHKIYNLSEVSDPSSHVPEIFRRTTHLWHDTQLLIRGFTTQQLYLHFIQRWMHSFTHDNDQTRKFQLTVPSKVLCRKKHQEKEPRNNSTSVGSGGQVFPDCNIRLLRNWNGSFDIKLFDHFCEYILSAKKFLYLEHQYPFQNGAITYYMCEALKRNPELRLIIVTPVKTDLPTGLLGKFFDWSQDHIIDHLNMLFSVAPDRVGIFALITQEEDSGQVKPIYVHSKLALIDDHIMVNGSTNMDNISFYYCSEVSAAVHCRALALEARVRLGREHLGIYWKDSMKEDPVEMFEAFCAAATENMENLRNGHAPSARPIWMVPVDHYEFLLKSVYFPTKLSKLMNKIGVNTQQVTDSLSALPGAGALRSTITSRL